MFRALPIELSLSLDNEWGSNPQLRTYQVYILLFCCMGASTILFPLEQLYHITLLLISQVFLTHFSIFFAYSFSSLSRNAFPSNPASRYFRSMGLYPDKKMFPYSSSSGAVAALVLKFQGPIIIYAIFHEQTHLGM